MKRTMYARKTMYFWIASLFGSLASTPSQASDPHIGFYVTNKNPYDILIGCDGPWSRITKATIIPAGATRMHFYDAQINILSPFGEWSCYAARHGRPNKEYCSTIGVIEGVANAEEILFNLDEPPPRPWQVDVTLNVGEAPAKAWCPSAMPFPRVTISTEKSQGPRSARSAAAAAPPHYSVARRRQTPPGLKSHDIWQFEGVANETVAVTLQRDGAKGSQGESARLNVRRGGSLIGSVAGSLPLTLNGKLPQSGDYQIEIISHQEGGKAPFKGFYDLSVAPSSDRTVAIELLSNSSH